MKVFISWSGTSSRRIAEALHTWLPKVIQSVDLWVSYEMERGSNWVVELAKGLEQARFAVVCATAENLDSAWMLYEAGAISMAESMNQRKYVCPYLFGIKSEDLPNPLRQFNTSRADKDGTRKLLQAINSVQERPLSDSLLLEAFELHWPALEEKLGKIPVPKKCIKLGYEKIKDLVESHRESILYKIVHEIIENKVIQSVAEGREVDVKEVFFRVNEKIRKSRELYRGFCTEKTRKDICEFFEENYTRDDLKTDLEKFQDVLRLEDEEEIEVKRKRAIHYAEAVAGDVVSHFLRKLYELEH